LKFGQKSFAHGRIQRREMEGMVRLVIENEIHQCVAKVANAVEKQNGLGGVHAVVFSNSFSNVVALSIVARSTFLG
jgi:uncharacterized protein YkvS